jgi:hypothetical protein
MDVRHYLGRLIALTVVLAMPLVGLAGVASAAPVGSAKWCAHHPHLAKTTYKTICAAATGTGTGGPGGTGPAGGDPPNLIVSASPDPVPEVGTSEADFVVQVESLAVFANQTVTISSQQLNLTCLSVTWKSSASAVTPNASTAISKTIGMGMGPSAPVTLDNEGNATVEVQGEDCTPGPDLLEADLTKAPYTTATTEVTLSPPTQSFCTAVGVPSGCTAAEVGVPTVVAAPNPEVETGDGGPGDAASQVYVNFLVEEDPAYAEGVVEVYSAQLTARCGLGTPVWSSTPGDLSLGDTPILGTGGVTIGVSAELDNDGNADVTFEGLSCAPGDSTVTADLVGGAGGTFSTIFTITGPKVTDI